MAAILGLMMTSPAFSTAAPRAAIALPQGRTYDQAHDAGYIDWSGSAQYVLVTHRDGSSLPPEEGGTFCTPSCTEWVTRLGTGGSASGSFDRDVSYFEIMVEFTPDSAVGNATLQACSSVNTWSLRTGSGLPGFVSMVLSVPAGCRNWSLSASAGYVDFRSIDVDYVAASPTPTATASPVPSATPSATATFTSTATMTETVTSTATATSTNTTTSTATATSTSTATATHTPTATFTSTFTASPTSTETLTSTPTATDTNTPRPSSTNTWSPTPNTLHVQRPSATSTRPAASATLTATPSPTGTATSTTRVQSTWTPTLTTVPVVIPAQGREPVRYLPLWQLLGLIGLFLVIASASVVDPRPAALDLLRERVDQLLLHSSNDEN